jgi:hypothetical protein
VPGCNKDLSTSRGYHQRYKICDDHFRVHSIDLNGQARVVWHQQASFNRLEDDTPSDCKLASPAAAFGCR